MRRQISVFLLSLPFLLSTLEAQTSLTISGVVNEKGTGNPVSGAEVSIVGGKANQDVTDSVGKFSLKFSSDVRPGAVVRIRVVKKGYETYTESISVSSELSVPVSLTKITRTKAPSNSQNPPQLQGKLFPSDEPTPANSCNTFAGDGTLSIGGDGILILMGFASSYVDRFPHTVLMVDEQPCLVVHKESDGVVWLSLDIFGADGKIIASLDEDGFTVRPGSYFKLTKKDKSSLRIVDDYNEEVLNVRYVNPHAIWLNALLRYPGSDRVTLKGSTGGGICTAHSGIAEIAINTKPNPSKAEKLSPDAVPPLPVQSVRIVSQDYLPSEDASTPYKLRVVVQTNVRIEPVSFVFRCSEIIEKGQVSFSGDGGLVSFKDRTGVLLAHKEAFLVSFESPAFTPEKPMLLDLYSKGPIKVLEFGQIPFTFP